MKISKLGLLALLGAADLFFVCGGTGVAAMHYRTEGENHSIQKADKYADYFLLGWAAGALMIAPAAGRFMYEDYRKNRKK
jgi:hypothetical protein